jgi:hypothetical protein
VFLLGTFNLSHLVKQLEAKELRLQLESKLAKDRYFASEEITDVIGIAFL